MLALVPVERRPILGLFLHLFPQRREILLGEALGNGLVLLPEDADVGFFFKPTLLKV